MGVMPDSYQRVGNPFKGLTVDGVAVGLGLLHCGTHVPSTSFKFDPDTLGIDCLLVAIPGETFHTHRRDVAAKTTKTL